MHVVVEGESDKAAARRAVEFAGRQVCHVTVTRGKTKLDSKLANDKRIRAGGRHGGGLRAWLAARHWTDLEAGRASLDDLVLHDEFLHTLRLFLDFHDYDGRAPSVIKPTDPLVVQRGRRKWAKKNADGEIIQSEKDEDWTISPSTLGQARRRSLALTAATSSWVGA